MANAHISNAFIGGFFASLSYTLFYFIHSHHLNLPHMFWTLTVLKKKWLFEYFPVVSGIFFTSGVLFNWMTYDGFGNVNPYGAKYAILQRTSMYGFALGGFLIGLGSQLVGGDEMYVSLVKIAQGSWFYIVVLALMLGSAFFWSWLSDAGYLTALTNQEINPKMQYLHLQSANITIGLAVIIIIVSAYMLSSRISDSKVVAKKIVGSFFSGLFLALGFGIAGLPSRTTFLAGITPNSSWDPTVLVFLGTAIVLCVFSLLLIKSNSKVKNIASREDSALENEIPKEKNQVQDKSRKCIGAMMFGMGWAISGLDVTTFLIHGSIFTIPVVIIFGLFLILGSVIGDVL